MTKPTDTVAEIKPDRTNMIVTCDVHQWVGDDNCAYCRIDTLTVESTTLAFKLGNAEQTIDDLTAERDELRALVIEIANEMLSKHYNHYVIDGGYFAKRLKEVFDD